MLQLEAHREVGDTSGMVLQIYGTLGSNHKNDANVSTE